ncbi:MULTISPECIES: flagellin [Vagococcus]|uniref:Flagellin n=2 Tax=Vagococcus fluvialis bH819 TaxID=1255619 RepID=A0A1X6WRL1_9ENTE|nr:MULTISPECIES: flagellin [Vagococcus]SLM86917.1 Flagellin protein FlaA [Vagococcus fluvialis bH819]HCM88626.1 flagellin [Vagococcus sp.]
MRINTNVPALNTYSRLTSANNAKADSLAKLSSGLRINRAGDDAAGLAISEKMKGQIGGLKQASRNAQDGISLIQTAEGALNETHDIINRMRDLATQGSNGTLSNEDRAEINKEFDALKEEVDRISQTTNFNQKNLLDGEFDSSSKQAVAKKGDVDMYMTVNYTDKKLDGAFDVEYTRDGNGNTNVVLTGAGAASYEVKDNEDGTWIIKEKDTGSAPDPVVEGKSVGVVKLTTEGRYGSGLVGMQADTANAGSWKPDPTTEAKHSSVFTEETTKTGLDFHVGANTGDIISVEIGTINSKTLGLEDLNLSDQKSAEMAINQLDLASSKISSTRSDLGAAQNRLQHTINNLSVAQENLTEANSRIRDVDMAEEMMNFTKNNILSQAATSMLAQANAMPQSVLSLLQ